MRINFTFSFLFFFQLSFSQSLQKIKTLDEKLHEISGIEVLNDSCFVAINDGGNEPILFVLNFSGEIIHKVKIENAQNHDWEDLSCDEQGNLYIADIGNNSNNRKNLCVYRVNLDSIFFREKLSAEKITFSYEDQKAFPPNREELNFDAEAISFRNDSLYIFTKCRTIPYSGVTKIYQIPSKPGNHVANQLTTIQLKKRKMKLDGVTSADFSKDTCFLLTYSGIEIFEISGNNFLKIKRKSFKKLTQKEAICYKNKSVFIADERFRNLLNAKFYKLHIR
jgi:hypothetical protein